MTQEHKELLLRDLCTRLPYEVKVQVSIDEPPLTIEAYDGADFLCDGGWEYSVEKIKPYLFPLTSMTDKQKEELFFNYIHNDIYFDDFTDYFLAGELWHDICVSIDILPSLIDWFNKNKIDWRGLIPMGLALDATGLNIY